MVAVGMSNEDGIEMVNMVAQHLLAEIGPDIE
jgi:hypothetical protein